MQVPVSTKFIPKKKKNPTGQSDNLVSPTGLTKDYDKSMKKNKLEINM